jgi:hypothetical protein
MKEDEDMEENVMKEWERESKKVKRMNRKEIKKWNEKSEWEGNEVRESEERIREKCKRMKK